MKAFTAVAHCLVTRIRGFSLLFVAAKALCRLRASQYVSYTRTAKTSVGRSLIVNTKEPTGALKGYPNMHSERHVFKRHICLR